MDVSTRNQETEAIVTSSRPVLEARVGPAMRNHNMEWSSSVLVFVLGIICLFGLFTESSGNNFVRFFTAFSRGLSDKTLVEFSELGADPAKVVGTAVTADVSR